MMIASDKNIKMSELVFTTTKHVMSELYSASLVPYPMSLSEKLLSQLFKKKKNAKGCKNCRRD